MLDEQENREYPRAHSETQTSVNPQDSVLIACNVCIYVATCEDELKWHMCDEHEVTSDLNFESDFPCETCGKYCNTENDLNIHQKDMKSLPEMNTKIYVIIVLLHLNLKGN